MSVLEYDGRQFTLPYDDTIPPATDEELASLDASVGQFGVLHTIYHTADDVVVSGGNRLRVCKKRGIPLVELPLKEISVEDADLLALQLNTAGRKWTRERLVATAKNLRAAGWSLRRIGEAIGVAYESVRRYLEVSEADPGVTIVTPETVTGADGKTYPASRPEKEAAEDDAAEADLDYPAEIDVTPDLTVQVEAEEPKAEAGAPAEADKPLDRKAVLKQFNVAFQAAQRAAEKMGKYKGQAGLWQKIYDHVTGVTEFFQGE